MRIFSHTQCISGVGHFVRAREIAYALAERHDVHVVDGGWVVPGTTPPPGVTFVEIPRIGRSRGTLAPLDGHRTLERTLPERMAILERAVRAFRPDALIIEQFPFSSWEFAPEFEAVIAAARASARGVKVVSSVRDVLEKTTADEPSESGLSYQQRVLTSLKSFDAVFVHADPRFTRVEDHVPWANELRTRLAYTGFVSEKRRPFSGKRRDLLAWLNGRRLVVASAGGSDRGGEFLKTIVTAWRSLAGAGRVDGHALIVFGALRLGDTELDTIRRVADGVSARVEPFAADFLEWLGVADLSISRPGYNTSANVLETRRRALLIPDSGMPDQVFRARRLGELGLAEVLESEEPAACAEAILRALRRPEPEPDLALDGADRTGRLLEAL